MRPRWPRRAKGRSASRSTLACGSGKRFEITGTALTNIPVIALTGGYAAVVNEAHTRFVCGDKVGHGVSEFMEQLI